MILSDAAIQILYNTKSNKSKKRDQNKINEYVEALAGIPDHNLEQKTSISRWFKRITDQIWKIHRDNTPVRAADVVGLTA
jgi:hypothetical protein